MAKQGLLVPRHMYMRQLQEIRKLAGICNASDNIELKLNWSILEKRHGEEAHDFLWYENGRLAGFLALYRFNAHEAEVGGMVHPDFRRSGIFSRLVEQAAESARKQGLPKLLFVCPHHSESAKGFLSSIGASYSFSEFGMKRVDPAPLRRMDRLKPELTVQPPAAELHVSLRRGTPEDRELMIRLDSQGFELSEDDGASLVDLTLSNPTEEWPYIVYGRDSEPVGRINIHVRDGNAHFFGFSVLPRHRRQGFGRRILTEAIRLAQAKGLRSMTLEVACENRKALELYLSCGFRETYVNDYYTWLL